MGGRIRIRNKNVQSSIVGSTTFDIIGTGPEVKK